MLQPLTDIDISHAAFRFARVFEANVAGVAARLARITYVGALGWEISCDAADAPAIWRALHGAGARPAGMHALDWLRLEKGYRHWGHDISPEDDPFEAGLDFVVKFDKNVDFIGRAALIQKRGQEPTRRLMSFQLEDPEPLLIGHEPVFRDGEVVGYVTSGGYGPALGAAIGLGYVTAGAGDRFEIEIAGERFAAKATLDPLLEPENPHMRA